VYQVILKYRNYPMQPLGPIWKSIASSRSF